MADDAKKWADGISACHEEVMNLSDGIRKLSADYIANSKKQRDQIKDLVVLKSSIGKTIVEYAKLQKNNRAMINDIVRQKKEINQLREAEEKLNKTLDRKAMTTKQSLEGVKNATKNALGQLTGLATTLGGVGISFGSIVQSGMEYEKTLYKISRVQQVAGKDSGSFSSALGYLRKNTSLAKSEFAELVSIIQSGFLGLKPSMQEVAELSEMIAKRVGPTFEAQKSASQELMQIQSQFPAIYEEILSLMKEQDKLKGGGSEAEKNSLNIRRQILQVTMQQSGLNKESAFMLQLTAEQTAEQEKYNEALKAQQEMNREIKNLQIKMYEELKPLMIDGMKLITKTAELTSEWSGTIGVVTKGVVALRTAQLALNIACNANPYVRAAGLIIATLTTIGAVIAGNKDKEKQKNKEAAYGVKLLEFEVSANEDINRASGEQKRILEEKLLKIKGSGKSVEEMAVEWTEVTKSTKQSNDEVTKQREKLQATNKDLEQRLALIDKITANLRTQNTVSEEFGLINEVASKNIIAMAEAAKRELAPALDGAIKVLKDDYLGQGIPLEIDISADYGKQLEQIQSQLLSQLEVTKDLDKQKKIRSDLLSIADKQKQYTEREADVTRARLMDIDKEIRQQESMTSVYEARLDAERRLMESAQFGMGASIDMMQKQVDLAYELQDAYRKADEDFQNRLKMGGIASRQDLERIKNAKTQAEAQDYIQNVMKKTGEQAQLLSQYAQKHQMWTKSILDQQQKIYDLTKEVREGYLDAIREMAVGAGEFEKIIGMQETGVTQLMGAVKDVTGEAKLNTMALGGTQSRRQTEQGVGTDITGQYTVGGIQFNKGGEDQRNKRIYKYQSYKDQADAAMRGEDTGARSSVGSATVAGVQEYLGPERNEEITPEQEIQRQAPTLKQTYKEAMTEALIAYSEKSVKVGPNSAGRFDVGGAAAIRANAISSGSMGAELLNSSSGSRASFGGAMPRSVSGEVEPSMSTKKTVKSGREKKESNESIITRSIEKIKKQIEEEEKKRSIALENIYKIDVDRTKNILRSKFTTRKQLSDELSQEKMRLEISSGKYSLSTENDKRIKKIKDLEEKIDKLNQNISKHQGNLRDRSRGTSDEYKMSSDRISQLKTSLEEERDVLSGYKEEEKLRQMDSLEESQKKMIAHSDQKKLKSQHVRFKKRQEAESGFYGGVKWGKEKALKLLEKEGEGRPSKRQEAESGFYGGVKWGREKALKLLEKEGEGRPSIDYKGISPEQEEALKRTSFLRSQIGTVKPKKGQTQEDADFRAATKYFEQQHIEKFAKADFERAMKDKEELKVKGTGSKTARFGSAAIDNVRSSGYTSAAQERGMEASALAQSNYEATASNRESVYGATGDEAGGSGVAVLTIKLADGLKGDLDNASGLRIELLQGSSR